MTALDIPPTLVLTGHFPPETGGVQRLTWELVRRLPSDRLHVIAPTWPGDAEFDARLDFPVVRRRHYLLFRGVRRMVRRHGVRTAWITALAPFGSYALLLRAAGIRRIVATSHGQEIGWTRILPGQWALEIMSQTVDAITYLNEIMHSELVAAHLSPPRWAQLAGGVDIDEFRPDADRSAVDARFRLGPGPVVLSVARLVRRKGHDVLLDAWADVLRRVPDARLLIVGDGPMRDQLVARAARDYPDSVLIAGAVPQDQLPAYYAAADVFVLPCRDDRSGLQTEGLGLSTLEASASGLPVVVGRSGGSVEALRPGETGLLVDASRPEPLAAALLELIESPIRARAMGAAGRRWVAEHWTWEHAAARLAALLRGDPTEAELSETEQTEPELSERELSETEQTEAELSEAELSETERAS